MPASAPVIVVSGLPRSGTSMVMRILVAGGVPALTDGLRAADEDNPHGYFEFERVKQLKTDRAWLDDAAGRAVKVIHMLLPELPDDRDYQVVFIERDLREVVRSQSVMLTRSGRRGASLPAERLIATYESQLAHINTWLAAHPRFRTLRVSHADLLADSRAHVRAMNQFLGGHLDEVAMAASIDRTLYRNKA